MNPEIEQLEKELNGLKPEPLNDAFLDRLSRAVDGTQESLSKLERATEARLELCSPAPLARDVASKLLALLEQCPFPGVEKVVPFPREGVAGQETKRRSYPRWAAAAAVALVGALTAVLVSPEDSTPEIRNVASAGDDELNSITGSAFMPASFESDVSDTEDLGVMWNGVGSPVRVVKVIYVDRAEFSNARGEEVMMKVPRVEYLIVPEKID